MAELWTVDERGIQTLHPAATERLHEYWVHGKGAAEIGWGSPGDFDRCTHLLEIHAHMSPEQAHGYCNLAHKSATGMYPATHAKLLGKHRSEEQIYMPTREDLVRAVAAKPYGNVKYADPGHQSDGKARYPIDTAEHVKAAWSYINQQDNASKYSPEQLAGIKARIKAAAKTFGIDIARSAGLDLCVRSFSFECEQRAGDGRTLEGYAAVFNAPTTIRDVGGDFEETILPGAFNRSLAKRTPILQWDHGKDPRIGTAPIGDIEAVSEDSKGLHVRARLYDHPDVERVRLGIAGRSIKGMSFRFGVPAGGDEWPTRDKRNIRDADVHELGPVAFPAYDATSVSVRSLLAQCDVDERRALIRELADDLRQYADLPDLAGRPAARSGGGGDSDEQPRRGATSGLSYDALLLMRKR